jgi:crotonobetaine/carnitine-CoA ligase
VKEYGSREFLYYKEKVFSFADLDSESSKVAAGFQLLGVRKGDKIAIMMNNRPEFIFFWFGISKLGAIEVPINTAHKGDLLSYMLGIAECRLMVVESSFLDQVAPALKDLPKLEKLIILGESEDTFPLLEIPTLNWFDVCKNNGEYEETEVLWSDPIAIMFTSGTTGASKGVVIPHNETMLVSEIFCEANEYNEEDCLYTILPLFHVNAQFASVLSALRSGARVVIVERFSASRFWSDVKKYNCTTFTYIGSILPILLKAEPKSDDADSRSLHLC